MNGLKLNTASMQFCPIPGGSFRIGEGGIEPDEMPEHTVTISHDFYMQETVVTNAQYELFDPKHREKRGIGGTSVGDNDACTNISYSDACAYAEWLAHKEGLPIRLPTEAEWEYACRAGTHSIYSTGDQLPWDDFTQEDFFSDTLMNLATKQHNPNPWGLYDMHGLIEEWCMDYYAPYTHENQTDPCGPASGSFRVTRGGSVNTSNVYLRSANRMGALSDTRNAIIGFRLVCSPTVPKYYESALPLRKWQTNVSQNKYSYRYRNKPVFKKPLVFVKKGEDFENNVFYPHNHVPSIAALDNGDLLAVWFSSRKECGRELTILASRFRQEKQDWDSADEFYKVPDRNMSCAAIVMHPNGKLYHFNGIAMSGTEFNLVSIWRESSDYGVTWSSEHYLNPVYSTNKPICAPFVDSEGCVLVPADQYDMHNRIQGTVLFRSDPTVQNFVQQTKYNPQAEGFMVQGQTAGWIAGVHGAVIQRKDGSLMAFGRSESRCGRQLIDGKMPLSVSYDMGKTWTYQPSAFPPIGFAQRCCALRLMEGPIVFFSFTDPMYDVRAGDIHGMDLSDLEGNILHGYGLFGAVSFDEGNSWPVQRLITTEKEPVEYDPGASCPLFSMDANHAQPQGYLQAVQSKDGLIHLISSRLHYQLNLWWLLTPHTTVLTE